MMFVTIPADTQRARNALRLARDTITAINSRDPSLRCMVHDIDEMVLEMDMEIACVADDTDDHQYALPFRVTGAAHQGTHA